MTDRNDPCPCGSGKKFKKCHGAKAGAQPVNAAAGRAAPSSGTQPAAVQSTPAPQDSTTPIQAAPPPQASEDEQPFLVHTGRGVESERADAERKKHLRKRLQSPEMRGTLIYNSGAFFRPPNP